MKVFKTKFKDALLIEPIVFNDSRGYFMECYKQSLLEDYGVNLNFIQENHSMSKDPGTIRGMHYQLQHKAQSKLVRVTRGAIYDVIVDIRRNSPTFGEWEGYILTEDNKRQLLVPKGFAHGFCTLVPGTEVQYKVDELYSKEHDRGFVWNDPLIGITWPVTQPVLSDKDRLHPSFEQAEFDFIWEGVRA
ncbi:dTDP-4-dehydrorhamnose 3,5-epimerase [Jeotgalibacillus sp. R-1-5s-1]|uniref:dTDP-4-dehydrorhamnose 3,5-epimerase n=1 Tax=Jeotgalibacillus sp. R-1-5s-1 TaxID=2555897 RepID=UPI00106CCC4F|nr:dTDP-4-dehydrorhamnose 3,5-epimerase [Jeotgalibacillus sp. R-1-5s-1]TFE00029.1 dTDP-4-dehydrorhamnose 3,5-epimerase [Jeotgalibacillus sp. R-1-5s-1]